MGYWTERDSDGPPKAAGWGKFKVARVITNLGDAKGGGPIKSKEGHQMIIVFLENRSGEETKINFTMNDKAAWVLAKFLSRAGVDLEAFEKRYPGLPPVEDVVKILQGKQLYGYAEISGKYSNFEPAHEHEVPAGILEDLANETTTAPDDDIPF